MTQWDIEFSTNEEAGILKHLTTNHSCNVFGSKNNKWSYIEMSTGEYLSLCFILK